MVRSQRNAAAHRRADGLFTRARLQNAGMRAAQRVKESGDLEGGATRDNQNRGGGDDISDPQLDALETRSEPPTRI